MISDERIKEYSELIDNDLGLDELLGLLAELIDDKHISEVVDKYIDDFNESFIVASNNFEALEDIKNIIKDVFKEEKNV